MTATVLIATTNVGKLREVQAVLGDLALTWVTLAEFPQIPSPVEKESTFEGNAKLKALYYAQAARVWTLADDSGLEVDALGGAPGVHSARYAGPSASTQANNRKLIEQLQGIESQARSARFRCCIAFASPEDVLAVAYGVVEGLIIDEPRGANGFGYDPHFWIERRGMTAAEMTPEEKNQISHRGFALRAIRPVIEKRLCGVGSNKTC